MRWLLLPPVSTLTPPPLPAIPTPSPNVSLPPHALRVLLSHERDPKILANRGKDAPAHASPASWRSPTGRGVDDEHDPARRTHTATFGSERRSWMMMVPCAVHWGGLQPAYSHQPKHEDGMRMAEVEREINRQELALFPPALYHDDGGAAFQRRSRTGSGSGTPRPRTAHGRMLAAILSSMGERLPPNPAYVDPLYSTTDPYQARASTVVLGDAGSKRDRFGSV